MRAANLEGKDLAHWKFNRYLKDYLRTIQSVDDGVGEVLDYLDENGLAENTIVVYTLPIKVFILVSMAGLIRDLCMKSHLEHPF